MEFLNVGFGELLLILLIALLVFGPERLPQMLHQTGRLLAQLRHEAGQLQALFMQETEPMRRTLDESRRTLDSAAHHLAAAQDQITSLDPVPPTRRSRDENSVSVRDARQPTYPSSQREAMPTPDPSEGQGQELASNEPPIPSLDDTPQSEDEASPAPSPLAAPFSNEYVPGSS